MILHTLASVIILGLVIKRAIHMDRKSHDQTFREFMEKEKLALNTPAKPLDDIVYIHIPGDFLTPSGLEDETALSYENRIIRLSRQNIINLNGMTNTDVRLKYGSPNFQMLSKADQNYISLMQVIPLLARRYIDAGMTDRAKSLLDFGLSLDPGAIQISKLRNSL